MSETGAFLGLPLRAARLAWRGFVDSLLPPQCMLCHAETDDAGRLCADCWPGVTFIAEPFCPSCGAPYTMPVPQGLVCGACLRQPPRFSRARSAFTYAGNGRELVLRFKRGDRTDLVPGLAAMLRVAGADLLKDCDIIAPVPLHRWRLWRRRFNQAAMLAQMLGRLTGKPAMLALLERPRPTQSLGRSGRIERRRILAGALRVTPGRQAEIAGRRILLIDDVLTTGATVNACSRVLLQAGASAVDVLTLARVVRPD